MSEMPSSGSKTTIDPFPIIEDELKNIYKTTHWNSFNKTVDIKDTPQDLVYKKSVCLGLTDVSCMQKW